MRKIKIKLPHSDNYALVHVCEDRAEFAKLSQVNDIRAYGSCIGCKVENYKRGKKPVKCEAALVYLIKNKVGAGYVSHELTHAVLYLLRFHLKRLLLTASWWEGGRSPDIEEYICDTMLVLQNKFWNWWFRNYDKVLEKR